MPFPHAGLPLAAARNAGRRAAGADTLIFLDVDCIPSAGLVAGLSRAVAEHDGLICCEIGYLPAGAVADGWREADLDRLGHPHPVRAFPPPGTVAPAPQPGLFWSLAFAVRAATYDRLGGFDEAFSGYGAEDTDLAFRADSGRRADPVPGRPPGLPPAPSRATIRRSSISATSSPMPHRFHARHGLWPMDGWLDGFARLGLIAADRSNGIVVRRDPTPGGDGGGAAAGRRGRSETVPTARGRLRPRSPRVTQASGAAGPSRDGRS